jgi:dTDP-4-dehydrorhamnose 3,5-epimerase
LKIETLSLKGPLLITPQVFIDERGFFFESFSPKMEALLNTRFVQDNHSFSKKNVLRGVHFQKGQAKLVRVISGEIFDVIVDIRENSETFGLSEGIYLKGEEELFVPDGFAHGFFVLTESATVLYKVSTPYNPALEKGFRYDDPFFKIKWPKEDPILSERDKNHPLFFKGL